jgi:hypothetical protein
VAKFLYLLEVPAWSPKKRVKLTGDPAKIIGFDDDGDVTLVTKDGVVGDGMVAWGDITGLIADQIDLNGALAGKVPTTRTVNGHALNGNVSVTKGDVGLANVDNTPDVSKPVSTAQQTALDGKQDFADNLVLWSAVDPADVLMVGWTPAAAYFDPSAINFTDVNLSTVLSGSTFTLVPGNFYFGDIGANRTFAFSPSPAQSDPATTVRFHATSAPITLTVPSSIRETDDAAVTTIDVQETGYYTLSFIKSASGDLRLYDTIPDAGGASLVLKMTAAAFTPTAGNTYYLSSSGAVGINGTNREQQLVTVAGTVTRVDIGLRVSGTNGTSESIGFNLRINDTTDVALTSATADGGNTIVYTSTTGLSQALAVGDLITIKIVPPGSFVTQPTSVSVTALITMTQ